MNAPPPTSICKGCNKVLSGRYIQALGWTWHPDCWRCEVCGKLLDKSFVERGGRAYHPACHDERFGLRCAICKEVIQGRYFQQDGQFICERDYLAKLAPRCYFCDEVLQGPHKVNEYGQTACGRHETGVRCSSCDRWLQPTEWLLPALTEFGTVTCDHCKPGAIGTREALAYNPSFGVEALRRLGLDLDSKLQVHLRIETTAGLAAMKGVLDPDVWGLTLSSVETIRGVESSRTIQGIAVIGGLAQEHFEGVLAHEYGHVWLFSQRLDQKPKAVVEGFCELIRFLHLVSLGTPLATQLLRKMLDNPDPVYGAGFRQMKSLWDETGKAGVINQLLS
jgi:LIM domain